jgi:hypothetical protein
MRFVAIMRSGAKIEFEAESVTISRHPLSGDVKELKWEGQADSTNRLLYLNVDEVDGVVRIK